MNIPRIDVRPRRVVFIEKTGPAWGGNGSAEGGKLMKHGLLYEQSELEGMARAEAQKYCARLTGWGVWVASDEATLQVAAKDLDGRQTSLTVSLPAPRDPIAKVGKLMELTWTKQLPTKPGWYWMRDCGIADSETSIVYLTRHNDQIYCHVLLVRAMMRAEWAGPIPEPKEGS